MTIVAPPLSSGAAVRSVSMRPVICAAPSMERVMFSPSFTSRRSTSHDASRAPEMERHMETVHGLPARIMSSVMV